MVQPQGGSPEETTGVVFYVEDLLMAINEADGPLSQAAVRRIIRSRTDYRREILGEESPGTAGQDAG